MGLSPTRLDSFSSPNKQRSGSPYSKASRNTTASGKKSDISPLRISQNSAGFNSPKAMKSKNTKAVNSKERTFNPTPQTKKLIK